jgi:hypothetical protein
MERNHGVNRRILTREELVPPELVVLVIRCFHLDCVRYGKQRNIARRRLLGRCEFLDRRQVVQDP